MICDPQKSDMGVRKQLYPVESYGVFGLACEHIKDDDDHPIKYKFDQDIIKVSSIITFPVVRMCVFGSIQTFQSFSLPNYVFLLIMICKDD